ncbi:hypothetical protein SAMN04488688_105217 [Paenibacillus sp. cl141a]|uniref:hypothetical protein n=1 Tax=Paenibacillus sp. cl141a TaxID=1761877 RepID=UPI0008CF59B2|nr:hypothetical protein [Paenibacillus sp. cl141a]SEL70364.1 hypothetical protein SAMN04488688_105217 [Paenibacillus sp. cl141a]
MPDILFLRDPDLPFLEIKQCDALDHLAYKKHFHEEISIGLIEQGATRVWSAGKRPKFDSFLQNRASAKCHSIGD